MRRRRERGVAMAARNEIQSVWRPNPSRCLWRTGDHNCDKCHEDGCNEPASICASCLTGHWACVEHEQLTDGCLDCRGGRIVPLTEFFTGVWLDPALLDRFSAECPFIETPWDGESIRCSNPRWVCPHCHHVTKDCGMHPRRGGGTPNRTCRTCRTIRLVPFEVSEQARRLGLRVREPERTPLRDLRRPELEEINSEEDS